MPSPVALFVYARPEHTRRTLSALQQNVLAEESDLIIYSDAARSREQHDAVREVRALLETVTGFRSLTIVHRQENFGLAKSIITGVTEVLEKSVRVIVLEDDMVTSPYFLSFMNGALDLYAHNECVASIHGYQYPVREKLPETFFLPGADCWGWATWRRAWAMFNPDGQYLLDELHRRKMTRAFNLNGAYPYSKMLENQINGKNDSWAIRWYASTFLAGKLTLYPGRSLVQNIGNDLSGAHSGATSKYDTRLSETPIALHDIPVEPSHRGMKANERFHRRLQPLFRRIAYRLMPASGITIVKKYLHIFYDRNPEKGITLKC